MENFNLIAVKYLPATNTRGSRVSMFSPRFKKRKTIAYDYQKNSTAEIAQEYLKENGFNIVGVGEFNATDIIISDTFKSL